MTRASLRVRLGALGRGARVALVVAAAARAAAAIEPAALSGRWATQGFGSVVEFRPCAGTPETMCGRILWLWDGDDSQGRPRTDRQNPDPALRARPLLGIEIVRGLRETEPGAWSGGELYNPDDGRTYTGAIRVRGGILELRGCALRVFCETQTWRRPEDLVAAVQRLGR